MVPRAKNGEPNIAVGIGISKKAPGAPSALAARPLVARHNGPSVVRIPAAASTLSQTRLTMPYIASPWLPSRVRRYSVTAITSAEAFEQLQYNGSIVRYGFKAQILARKKRCRY